jgi:hypothetical protein
MHTEPIARMDPLASYDFAVCVSKADAIDDLPPEYLRLIREAEANVDAVEFRPDGKDVGRGGTMRDQLSCASWGGQGW